MNTNRSLIAPLLTCAVLWAPASVLAEATFLTGEIEDGGAQIILMPRFEMSDSNTRQVEWMAPEGSSVEVGDLVVRLDPSDLITRKDTLQIDMEDRLANAESQYAQQDLQIFDAETALIRAESQLEIAKLNASMPQGTVPELTFQRNKLSLANATNALKRAIRSLEDAERSKELAAPVIERDIQQAASDMEEIDNDVKSTEIYATQPGLVIYGVNSWTGEKVFPGASVYRSMEIAKVASKEDLQFRFWTHEADVRKLSEGSQIEVTADSLQDLSIRAKVSWISSQANTRDWSEGGYFEVIAVPDEGAAIPDQFLPGMTIVGEVL